MIPNCYTTGMARKLRIAVSVFFALIAVMVSAIWVRSYWRFDVVHFPTTRPLLANSTRGVFQLNFMLNDINTGWQPGWGWMSVPPARVSWQSQNAPTWSWSSDRYVTSMSFPAWPVVLVCGLAAGLVSLPCRFSLRTLLIATTLVAVVLGMGVWLAS